MKRMSTCSDIGVLSYRCSKRLSGCRIVVMAEGKSEGDGEGAQVGDHCYAVYTSVLRHHKY